jgi:hypothetical protein
MANAVIIARPPRIVFRNIVVIFRDTSIGRNELMGGIIMFKQVRPLNNFIMQVVSLHQLFPLFFLIFCLCLTVQSRSMKRSLILL